MASRIVELIRVRRVLMRAAGLRPRRQPKIPRQQPPAAARLEYQALLTQMRRDLHALIESDVVPQLGNFAAQSETERGNVRADDRAFDAITRVFSGLEVKFAAKHPAVRTREVLQRVGEGVDKKSSEQHQRQMKAALGVELIAPEPFKAAAIDGFVAQNLDLIESLTGGALDGCKQIVASGVRSGVRVEDIASELEDKLGVTESKAALLARDQTGKLFAELNQMRQQNVDVEEYTWSTSNDERVRPRHADLEGTVQRWSQAPIVDFKTGRRAHAGADFQCRCVPIPVIPDDYLPD